MVRVPKTCVVLVLVAMACGVSRGEERKFFAHYMGCFPATAGWLADAQAKTHSLTNSAKWEDFGGAGWINRPLMPLGFKQSEEENAAFEVRRAMRAGLDGFAVDAWAGDDGAKRRFEMLLKAAEPYGGKFQVTVCLDPACHVRGYAKDVPMWQRFADTVNYVLKFRESSALATFDGRPLILTYHMRFIAGWGPEELIAAEWTKFRAAVPKDVFLMGDIDYLVKWDDPKVDRVAAVRFAAKHFEALGGFIGAQGGWGLDPLVAETTKSCGRIWCQPMLYQYQNPRGAMIASRGLDRLAANWENARKTGSRLIQFVTWNDYGEETTLAPSVTANYTLTRLCRHWAEWWKTGVEPKIEEDEVHVVFRRTADWSAESWPYAMRRFGNLPEPVLEVVTLLKEPSTVQVKDYGEYEAPKGLFRKQFPLKAGLVAVRVRRSTLFVPKTVCGVIAPERVSDRRWREDYSCVAYGSNYEREWELDFPGTKPLKWSEMGDVDGDGMPNWFEMAFFGKYPDMTTAGAGDPDADPDGDGVTNRKEYERQTNPLVADAPYPAGFAWRLGDLVARKNVWNPSRDEKGRNVWYAFNEQGELAACGHDLVAKRTFHDGNFNFKTNGVVAFGGRRGTVESLAWRAPVDGVYTIDVCVGVGKTGGGGTNRAKLQVGDDVLQKVSVGKEAEKEMGAKKIRLTAGTFVRVIGDFSDSWGLGPLEIRRLDIRKH